MIMLSHPLLSSRQSAFALISVLALVSLAALTATAFLASARLERQATSSISTTTRLEMTLSAGRECAAEILDKVGQPGFGWNFVTTYWRTNIADELGYPLIGGANSKNNLRWTYYCGFTPATWTNLDTNFIGPFIKVTNLICQSSFSNDIAAFMTSATNGFSAVPSEAATSKVCTLIPMLGGRTSPPVGWVYIRQNIRTNPAATNTAYLPVARFAYFIEDLQGLIDAERMGGLTLRDTGTNAEEISMSNLTGVTITDLEKYTNSRGQYITPSMLLTANGGFLSSTNDLRYFASRLRSCPFNDGTNWDRIPSIPISSAKPYYPTNAGFNKRSLNTNLNSANGLTNIAYTITNNFPNFTNRAGGMNGTNYALALAANIIDYVDTDPSPTTNGSTVGYDNYPLPVVFSDRIALNGANPLTNTNNLAAATITVTTYVQLWNCSTLTSPAVTYSLVNNFQDVLLRSNGSSFPNNQIFTNRPLTNPLVVPALPPNAVVILAVTNSTTVGPRAGIPGGLAVQTNTLTINHINGNSYTNFTNLFELSLGGKIISQHKGSYTRIGQKITNGLWDWEGTALLMSRSNTLLAPIGDPRMLRFQSNPAAIPLAYRSSMSGSLRWGGYPYYEPQGLVWNGHPDNWPEGRKSTAASPTGTGQTGGAGGSLPVAVGTPTNLPGTAPAILSTNGKFLTIWELGNVFDPMQWKPPATFTANTNYYNCSINQTWTNVGAELHGGGTTLRIGRPEHSAFAFTNLGGTYPTPNLGQSAAGLLDLFCVTNTYNWAGKININTAPAPVLAALAGGIKLTRDPNKVGSEVNDTMINAFTNGVMRFRQTYPFITPSQLAFISRNYGTNPATPPTCWTNTFPSNAVFSSSVLGGLNGVSSINDQGFEEWFAKIYALTTVQSFNYRIYVVAQLTDTNGLPKGAPLKKYYQLHLRNNNPNPNSGDSATPSVSQNFTYEAFF
jgi:hypothetical protein